MSNKTKITIVTVNYNTSDFIELMLYAFSELTDTEYSVLILDNGSRPNDILHLVSVVKRYNNIKVIFKQQTEAGSIAHGKALDSLLGLVETPYVVVMDSDATFLAKHWDVKALQSLDQTTRAVGTPPVSSKHSTKATDFPFMFATLYDVAVLRDIGVSFCPVQGEEGKGKDTGWEVREGFLNRNLKGKVWRCENTRDDKLTPFGTTLCAVYFDSDNTLMASHFGRGSSLGTAKYLKRLRIPLLANWLRRRIGRKEKEAWISRCREIIDAQKT